MGTPQVQLNSQRSLRSDASLARKLPGQLPPLGKPKLHWAEPEGTVWPRISLISKSPGVHGPLLQGMPETGRLTKQLAFRGVAGLLDEILANEWWSNSFSFPTIGIRARKDLWKSWNKPRRGRPGPNVRIFSLVSEPGAVVYGSWKSSPGNIRRLLLHKLLGTFIAGTNRRTPMAGGQFGTTDRTGASSRRFPMS